MADLKCKQTSKRKIKIICQFFLATFLYKIKTEFREKSI